MSRVIYRTTEDFKKYLADSRATLYALSKSKIYKQ